MAGIIRGFSTAISNKEIFYKLPTTAENETHETKGHQDGA